MLEARIGVIGGSGLYRMQGVTEARKVNVSTPFGEPSAAIRGRIERAREVERLVAGEILLTSVDREGTWKGFDVDLTARVSAAVRIPVIANGGAGSLQDIGEVVKRGGASAVGLGSMVVYQGRGMGVLVNFPDRARLAREIS